MDFEQQKEIVLTYRSEEQAEPVQLRYERDLPESMLTPPPAPAPLWRAAIAPPEKPSRGSWGMRLFVILSVLVVAVCLGLGIWYALRGGGDGNVPPPYGGGSQAPYGDGDFYYWSDEEPSTAETTIARYPTGGDAAMALVSAPDQERLTPQEVYQRVNPSVVTVLGYQSTSASVGTGIVFTSDGYLLTNYHVIAGSYECLVLLTDAYGVDSSYSAQLVGYDVDNDLAVLKVDAQGLTAAEFGVSDELTVGDKVYAIGNPLGMELRGTFTDGIVSAINRDVDVDGITMTLLQTNAALNSGNSGGPLINEYGQVVGINTIKMMSGYDTIEGLGFAIPTSLAVRWVNEIIQFGQIQPQPVLGLSISRIPTTLPDGSSGLEIMEVTAGLGGEKAGIQVGDYVVAFAGESVSSTEDILALRRDLYVGDLVSIRVWRNGIYLDLTLEMMESGS